jgi:transcription termination/antitermination protein NusA
MNREFLEAVKQLAESKGIDRQILIEAIESALSSASRRSHLESQEMRIKIVEREGEIVIVCVKTVVEEVVEEGLELSLAEAQELIPDVEVGDELEIPVDPESFGRNAAQIAKQVVIQKIHDAERDQVYDEFVHLENEIITGTVKGDAKGTIVVDLGKAEGVIPFKEKIPGEDLRIGDRIRAYVLEVKKKPKGPSIVLSRTHPRFVVKLFELEVPEIYDKTLEIMAIAREPGSRTKMAVRSNDPNVDPVGTCVGMRGYRVQAVVRELNGEKIDIFPWSDDAPTLVTFALAPAAINRIVVDEETDSMLVVVPDEQLSLAIGKNGQNVRLAAKLSGWHIDIKSETQYNATLQEEAILKEEQVAIYQTLPAVDGLEMAEDIFEEGFVTIKHLALAEVDELAEALDVPEEKALEIIDQARTKLEEMGIDLVSAAEELNEYDASYEDFSEDEEPSE